MKIRIKGDSLRLRLTQSEVAQLAKEGKVQSSVGFTPLKALVYGLEIAGQASEVSARFEENVITVSVPQGLAKEWTETDLVGFDAQQPIEEGRTLSILIEKDFHCLVPRAGENESDQYPNPLAKAQ